MAQPLAAKKACSNSCTERRGALVTEKRKTRVAARGSFRIFIDTCWSRLTLASLMHRLLLLVLLLLALRLALIVFWIGGVGIALLRRWH